MPEIVEITDYEVIIKDEEKLSRIPGIDSILGEEKAENYYQLPVFRSNFEKQDFKNIVFKGCYPLNPIASCMLLNVSEKVAQNERTLFTFISSIAQIGVLQIILYQVIWKRLVKQHILKPLRQ